MASLQLKTDFGDVIIEGDFSSIADAVKAALTAKKSLRSANLSYADLRSANLSSALHAYSQIAFTGHGECGRMLTTIQLKKDGPISFFCGCFTGTEKQLRKYIMDGADHLKRTRLLALETSLVLIAAQNDQQK